MLHEGCTYLPSQAVQGLSSAQPGVLSCDEVAHAGLDVGTTFGIVGDSLSVISGVNGEACLEDASRGVHETLDLVTTKLVTLWEAWAAPAQPLRGWVLWRKREFNAAADCLAGWYNTSRVAGRAVVGTLPLRLGNCWAWFDGSLRAGLGVIGAAIACWGAGGTGEPDAVLMESHCLGGGHGDITLLEAKALELAVTRLADGRSGLAGGAPAC